MPSAAAARALGADRLQQAESGGDHGHEGRRRPDGQPDVGELHALDALRAARLLHLVGIGVVIGDEEIIADGLDGRGIRHAQRRRRVDRTVQSAGDPLVVGMAQDDSAFLDQVPVLRMPQASGEDADVGGAELAEDRLQQHRAPLRVRIAGPLGEDIGALAADGGGRLAQGRVCAGGLPQQAQVVPGESLAQDLAEALHDGGLGRDLRPLEDLGRLHAGTGSGPAG